MPDDIEFLAEDEPGRSITEKARKEEAVFGRPPPKPNTVVIPLWRNGHVSFDPDSSVPVFALLSLVLLLLVVLLLAAVGYFIGAVEWLESIFTALGHAIVGVVGAIVGSSVSGTKSD